MEIKKKLAELFGIFDGDYKTCTQLLNEREKEGKLDQRKLLQIVKIICDLLEDWSKLDMSLFNKLELDNNKINKELKEYNKKIHNLADKLKDSQGKKTATKKDKKVESKD